MRLTPVHSIPSYHVDISNGMVGTSNDYPQWQGEAMKSWDQPSVGKLVSSQSHKQSDTKVYKSHKRILSVHAYNQKTRKIHKEYNRMTLIFELLTN